MSTSAYAPDVVAFIEARLAEIEEVISNTTTGPWKSWGMSLLADRGGGSDVDHAVPVARVSSPPQFDRLRTWNLTHIQDWQPMVAQEWVDATRRIVERYKAMRLTPLPSANAAGSWVALGEVLIDLAYVWHTHPDWDESWEVK